MIGDKYREIGNRSVISLWWDPDCISGHRIKIYQGKGPYRGRVGTKFVSEMVWTNEAEAQAFLDRLAKVRGWKLVRK